MTCPKWSLIFSSIAGTSRWTGSSGLSTKMTCTMPCLSYHLLVSQPYRISRLPKVCCQNRDWENRPSLMALPRSTRSWKGRQPVVVWAMPLVRLSNQRSERSERSENSASHAILESLLQTRKVIKLENWRRNDHIVLVGLSSAQTDSRKENQGEALLVQSIANSQNSRLNRCKSGNKSQSKCKSWSRRS